MSTENMTVLVGMSGGVDSSVAALLLQKEGYHVIGGTFKLYRHGGCGGDDVADAKKVCDKLGIEHHVFDFTEIFRTAVVDKFVDAYEHGLTPNPCVDCNRAIKFGEFVKCADELGAKYIATGHYGKVVQNNDSGRYELHMSDIDAKDQSYMLYSLGQAQLSRLLLPLYSYDKSEIRAIAEEAGLEIFSKPDSQDVCFIPEGTCAEFLESYTGHSCPHGNFVDTDGKIIGQHSGIWKYTIGQRKGLGTSFGRPVFVADISAESGNITLSDEAYLFKSRLVADNINLIQEEKITEPKRLLAKIRYSAKPQPATVTPLKDGRLEVVFDTAQRAITKGQAVVLYSGKSVFGGGTIVE